MKTTRKNRSIQCIANMLCLMIIATTLNAYDGVNHFFGQKETYYNLPMERIVEKAEENGIYGDYWVREDGVKMYGHYVIVAAPWDIHPYGSTVETSLGEGIVLDTGKFADVCKHQVDIAVSW